MNKLLSKLLGGLIIVTSIVGPMSAFGVEVDSGQAILVESNSTVSEEVYGSTKVDNLTKVDSSPIVILMEESNDYGGDFESATELAINTEVEGQISSSDDIDFFKFTTNASEGEYTFEFSGTGTASFNIYDFERDCIDGYSFDSENSYILNRTFQPNKEYYLEIKSDESNVSYTVSFKKWPDDHGYDRSSSKTLTLSKIVAGKINYINDTDYFKFTADTKGMYNIECNSTGVAQLLILKDGENAVNRSITANEGYSYSLNLNANETCYLQIVSSFADVDYRVKIARELLQNPNFTDNTTGWSLWTQNEGVAKGTRDTKAYESVDESSDAAYRIDCTSKGSANNHIQLYTVGINVEAGKTYKLSFMARSEGGNSKPLIQLMQKSSPYEIYGKQTTVDIGSEWKLYNVYFTPNKTDSSARLTFFLGNRLPEGGKLYLDSLSFTEYVEYKEEVEYTELLNNPSFEKGADGWKLYTQSGAVASGTRDTKVYDTAPAGYRVDCKTKGTGRNHIQWYTTGINVQSGKRYKLTFRAKSEGGNVTSLLSLMQKDSPYTLYAPSIQVLVGPDWNTYEVYFDSNATDSSARLTFYLGNGMPSGSKLYIDSMSMVEVSK